MIPLKVIIERGATGWSGVPQAPVSYRVQRLGKQSHLKQTDKRFSMHDTDKAGRTWQKATGMLTSENNQGTVTRRTSPGDIHHQQLFSATKIIAIAWIEEEVIIYGTGSFLVQLLVFLIGFAGKQDHSCMSSCKQLEWLLTTNINKTST